MIAARANALVALWRRGWSAPPRELLAGALMALTVSGSLAITLGVFAALPVGLIAFVAGGVQLALAYGCAGALVRRKERGESR